jgi:tRNA dimethylallyltransferase
VIGRTVIALVGCTATGKTAVAEHVADALGGEVVCADSRQVFRELEIGTGKPTPPERQERPHHLFESLSVAAYAPLSTEGAGPRATAGWYARAARDTCAAIHARSHVPVLVGGSGLYLRAAQSGLAPTPPVDAAVRQRVMAELERLGPAALHERLLRGDAISARAIHASDAQRITRALEVLESTGRPLAWWRERPATPAVEGAWRIFRLTAHPDELRRRIEQRTRWMFDSGLVEETRSLIAHGLGGAIARLRAIGYDETLAMLDGRLGRAEAESLTRLRTAQLAKRQRTWFAHQLESEEIPTDGASSVQLAEQVVARTRRAG